jgi:hypothetical protein
MQSFQTVSQEELIDSLMYHYQQYRKLIGYGGTEKEHIECREMLSAIVEELTYRRKFWTKSARNRVGVDPASGN